MSESSGWDLARKDDVDFQGYQSYRGRTKTTHETSEQLGKVFKRQTSSQTPVIFFNFSLY